MAFVCCSLSSDRWKENVPLSFIFVDIRERTLNKVYSTVWNLKATNQRKNLFLKLCNPRICAFNNFMNYVLMRTRLFSCLSNHPRVTVIDGITSFHKDKIGLCLTVDCSLALVYYIIASFQLYKLMLFWVHCGFYELSLINRHVACYKSKRIGLG